MTPPKKPKEHHLPELPEEKDLKKKPEGSKDGSERSKDEKEPAETVKKSEQGESDDSKSDGKPDEEKPKKRFSFRNLFRWSKKEPEDKEERAQKIVKGIRKGGKPKKRKRLQRKSLQQYIDKAGYDADAERIKKRVFQVIVGLFLVGTGTILYLAACWGENACSAAGVWRTLLLVAAIWTVIFAACVLVAMGVIYFFLDYRIYRRTKELEDVLPDFLQLASANIAAGMPIDRALWYSIRPNFGILAKEMEEVAKRTMSGESLEDSLTTFSEKYDSKLLQRSISILLEGLHSGGELADLLNKIALNIDEIKIMKKEMAANVTTYAIFILVAAVGIAPFLFALATQLLSIIVQITATLDLGSTTGFFTISAVDPGVVDNFKLYSYAMLIVSSVFGASIVSIIQRGNILEGVKSIPVYAAVAILLYLFGLSFFGGIFGGIV